ncbi:MAG: aspartate-semialdehyde dehydrogenase [Verrucomicrobia bacterium]|jgi:aspartate-semialdehyde dehydrogenase|nr:aspartate-semialdehyde dehydrogenase [Verrucomicrobiota bacterium]
MKRYKVGIVGIGAVGTEMVKILRERDFPCDEIRIMARSERDETVAGETFHVVETKPESFDGLDFAFFAGTEGSKGASQLFGWEAVSRGVTVIDNGDDFRMDDRVPLVVPEVNGDALKDHQGFIANPNCSTIIAMMALGPLHKAAGIRRIVASTYQAVSGTGRNAIVELENQLKQYVAGETLTKEAYPHQILLNVLPQIGGLKAEMPGYTSEEAKMLFEARKILGNDEIKVSTTCVRVPVFFGHSEAINIEFERPVTPEEAREILSAADGVQVVDNPSEAEYPLPLDVAGKDDCLVGRIRPDDSAENGLALFVAGDNIRKGAALNAIQIAEYLIKQQA